jgi:Arc/MetJ family transcription regulator
MRTTVNLDDDVAAAIARLQQEGGLGVSEAVNQLARAGLRSRPRRAKYRQRSARIGLMIDISNVAEALEVLDGPAH